MLKFSLCTYFGARYHLMFVDHYMNLNMGKTKLFDQSFLFDVGGSSKQRYLIIIIRFFS